MEINKHIRFMILKITYWWLLTHFLSKKLMLHKSIFAIVLLFCSDFKEMTYRTTKNRNYYIFLSRKTKSCNYLFHLFARLRFSDKKVSPGLRHSIFIVVIFYLFMSKVFVYWKTMIRTIRKENKKWSWHYNIPRPWSFGRITVPLWKCIASNKTSQT